MPLNEKYYRDCFKAFGDQTRIRILGIICNGEMTVNEIAKAARIKQPSASRHLAVLKRAGVVIDRREGQRVFYRLNVKKVDDCCQGFRNCLVIQIARPVGKRKE